MNKFKYFEVKTTLVENPFKIDNSFRRNPKPNPYDDELPGMHDDKKAIIIYITIFWFAPFVYLLYRLISNN